MKKVLTILLVLSSMLVIGQQAIDNGFLTTNSTTGNFNITNIFKIDNTNQNLCVGYTAGQSIVTGDGIRNTVFGQISGDALTTGDGNCLFGRNAGGVMSTAIGNCLFGSGSGAAITLQVGQYNSFFGYESGYKTTTGNNNVFIGRAAGHENLVGVKNVFIGAFSGFNNTGSDNVFIGYTAGYNETGSDLLYIANSSTATPLIYGDFATDSLVVNGKLTVTNLVTTGTYINIGALRHSFMRFADSTSTYDFTQNNWQAITNSGDSIFRKIEFEDITYSGDSLILNHAGDYDGILSISISGANNDSWEVRVNHEGVEISKMLLEFGANVTAGSVTVPFYIYEGSVGDYVVFEIRNTANDNDPTFKSAIATCTYLHE